jgi:hypothetical protein
MRRLLSKRDSKSREKLSDCDSILSGWDRAIADAKKGIVRLESAIGVFERRKQAGEPWPGDVAGTENKSVPA